MAFNMLKRGIKDFFFKISLMNQQKQLEDKTTVKKKGYWGRMVDVFSLFVVVIIEIGK